MYRALAFELPSVSSGWVSRGVSGLFLPLASLGYGTWRLDHEGIVRPWLFFAIGLVFLLRWIHSHARYDLVKDTWSSVSIERQGRFWGRAVTRCSWTNLPKRETECVAGFEPQHDYQMRSGFDLDGIAEVYAEPSWTGWKVKIRLEDGFEYAGIPFALSWWRARRVAADWNRAVIDWRRSRAGA